MKILITGGAGFVGSQFAIRFKQNDPANDVVAFDNLRRRGSELNLAIFKRLGIRFIHGDVRNTSDLADLRENFDLLIEASAEPSVQAGVNGNPDYSVETNLIGSFNCLNFARNRADHLLFLSTSRVYSIAALRSIRLKETESRFVISDEQDQPGISALGINEHFTTLLPRSIYGATKLGSELLVQEFSEFYGLKAVIYRCGVIAGPGQFGRVDQGVFMLWVANHYFQKPLCYTGFGGEGKQVRDLLHPQDLFDLVTQHLPHFGRHSGQIFNVGGGFGISVSLAELTALCQQIVGNKVSVASNEETHSVDVPWYISDCSRLNSELNWRPTRDVSSIVTDILSWLRENEKELRKIFD